MADRQRLVARHNPVILGVGGCGRGRAGGAAASARYRRCCLRRARGDTNQEA